MPTFTDSKVPATWVLGCPGSPIVAPECGYLPSHPGLSIWSAVAVPSPRA